MTIIMLLTAAPYPKRLKFKYCGKRSHILYVRLKTLLSVSSANSISEKKIMASNFKNDTVFLYPMQLTLSPKSKNERAAVVNRQRLADSLFLSRHQIFVAGYVPFKLIGDKNRLLKN